MEKNEISSSQAEKIKSTKLITFKFSKPDPNKNVCTSIPMIQKYIR